MKFIEYSTLQNVQKQFQNIQFLSFTHCVFKHKLSINDIFPNVRVLKLGENHYFDKSIIRIHLPGLTELYFHAHGSLSSQPIEENDVDEVLKLHPQLEKLVLCSYTIPDSKILQIVKKNCPNLRHFELYCHHFFSHDPIHFEHIETFGIYLARYFYLCTHLEIRPFKANMLPSDLYPNIRTPELTTFKFSWCYENVNQLFENESMLNLY